MDTNFIGLWPLAKAPLTSAGAARIVPAVVLENVYDLKSFFFSFLDDFFVFIFLTSFFFGLF